MDTQPRCLVGCQRPFTHYLTVPSKMAMFCTLKIVNSFRQSSVLILVLQHN